MIRKDETHEARSDDAPFFPGNAKRHPLRMAQARGRAREKVVCQVEAEADGRLAHLLADEGDEVPVDAAVAVMETNE